MLRNIAVIEAIIAMPSEMFEYTRVQTLMLVLSFENKGVRFIDASGICVKGRRYNTFSDTNIEEIIRLCSADSKNSKFVSNEDISANDYILEPKMYLEIKREIINGVPLGELLRSVTRGSQITAAQLDKIASEKPTNYCYLRLADIQNGQVATELPYLVSIEKKLEKYSIKDKCMIVSKIGNPIKTAVITVPEEMAVLVTGNMYVLELDESKVDPYYVQAYFESKIGASYLNSLSVGVAIQNLPLESLTKMQIPVPAMEVQKRIAEEYLAAVEEIRKYKNKIIEVENRIRKGFEMCR